MLRTSVRRVGNSLGITLPRAVLDNFHLREGDEIHLVETEEGIMLTPYDPEFREWVEAYDKTNRRYRNTLRRLAK